MDVFIYTYEPLPCGLDEVEDALEAALGDRGRVTGGGTGISDARSNFDLLIKDGVLSEEQVLSLVRQVVLDLDLPKGTMVDINGKEHLLD